jgi:hypothetical protein
MVFFDILQAFIVGAQFSRLKYRLCVFWVECHGLMFDASDSSNPTWRLGEGLPWRTEC